MSRRQQQPRPPAYREGGYPCKYCGKTRPTPQLLGAHVRLDHAPKALNPGRNGRNGHSRPAAKPWTEAKAASLASITNPALLQITGRNHVANYYLIDQDDSTRMFHLDRVIEETLER